MKKGVGDLIASWIPEWAVIPSADCNCEEMRDEMNRVGPAGVLAEIERYENHFVSQKKYLRKYLQTIPEIAMRKWVRLVIQRACNAVRDDLQPKVVKDTRKRKS